MNFIKRVRIQNFRSLEDVTVDHLCGAVPIVGINGSGKSNFLRALNLLFNGEVEPGEPVVIDRDLFSPKGTKRRRPIVVTADIDLGERDLVDALAGPIKEVLGALSQTMTIERRVSYLEGDRSRIVDELLVGRDPDHLRVVTGIDQHYADRILGALRFRYFSNEVASAALLAREEPMIRRVLFRRLRKYQDFGAEPIETMKRGAQTLLRPVARGMQSSTRRIAGVSLRTPSDWGDLAWAAGFSVESAGGAARDAEMHGSGVQALLAYLLLYEIDTDFGGTFGTRRGAVWAVEEPESFLHADLQAELAQHMMDWSQTDRLQIFLATHNTAFLGLADRGLLVEPTNTGASRVTERDRVELLDLSSVAGVVRYAHPLHAGTVKPLLLLEGKTDKEIVARAYQASRDLCPYDIKCMADIDPTVAGGLQTIHSYLKNNKGALRARPPGSPVVVLADNDKQDKTTAEKIAKTLAAVHPQSCCQRWPIDKATDGLQHLHGIESFLSASFFEDAADELGFPLAPMPSIAGLGWHLLSTADFERHKSDFHKLLRARDRTTDIQPVVALVPWINSLLMSA